MANLPAEVNKSLMSAAWGEAVKITQDALKKAGVTHDLVAKRLKQALNAKEVECKFDGGTEKRKGVGWVYSKPLIAHHIRVKALPLAAKLLLMEPPEQKIVSFDEATLNALLNGLPADFAAAVRAELTRALSEKRD